MLRLALHPWAEVGGHPPLPWGGGGQAQEGNGGPHHGLGPGNSGQDCRVQADGLPPPVSPGGGWALELSLVTRTLKCGIGPSLTWRLCHGQEEDGRRPGEHGRHLALPPHTSREGRGREGGRAVHVVHGAEVPVSPGHQDDNYHMWMDAHSAKAGKWKAVGSVLKESQR